MFERVAGKMAVCGLVLLTWTFVAAPLNAQQAASGTVQGRVLDTQRQGVSARVQVVQVQTGLQRETQSDPAGRFALTSIPPGDIVVIVSAPGFAEWRREGIALEVGQGR